MFRELCCPCRGFIYIQVRLFEVMLPLCFPNTEGWHVSEDGPTIHPAIHPSSATGQPAPGQQGQALAPAVGASSRHFITSTASGKF